MAEDPYSPRSTQSTLADRLKATGNKMSELSKKAADATKGAVDKMANAGREAVAKTNEAVSGAVEARKEKKHEKLTEKIEQTKSELKDDGHIALAPAMITLPEFEEERMAVMAEEHDILVDLVDQMLALSERIDALQSKVNGIAYTEQLTQVEDKTTADKHTLANEPSQPMKTVLAMLGASLIWVVVLTGLDRYIGSEGWLVLSTYPAQIPVWGIGAGTWIAYVLHQIAKVAPVLRVPGPMLIQTAIAVSVSTMLALLLSDDTLTAMSNFWIWGTGIAIVVLLCANFISYTWKTTSQLLSVNENSEIIK